MKNSLCTLLACSILLNGCATIFNGSKDTIYVRSEDSKAKIYVDNIYVGTGSGQMTISKKGDHIITATKEGCQTATRPVEKSFDPTTLLGILLDWGIISILIIDWAATGAVSKYQPIHYVVNPECPSEDKAASSGASSLSYAFESAKLPRFE